MTALRRRLLEDRPLRGLAPRPPPCDLEAVWPLRHHDRRAPEQLREAELRQYGRCLITDQQVAERTWRVHREGSRFCSERTRQRPGPVCDRVRPRNTPQLPVALSRWEGRSRLALVKHPNARRCLRMLEACGLLRTDGTQRQVAAIDAQRMRVRGHQGPGGQERGVPLAPRGLA